MGLVVFDLDGTLVDSSRDIGAALNTTLGRLHPGARALPDDEVRAYIGDGARTLVSRALRAVGASLDVEAVFAPFLEEYERRLLDTTGPYPHVAETLDALRPRHALAVLTNKPGRFSRRILEGLGLLDRFLRVWGPDDAGARKPDPAGLLRLVSEAGADRGSTWMVGDSAIDVRTARAAGVSALAVTYGYHPESLREAPPDRLLGDLRELPALVG